MGITNADKTYSPKSDRRSSLLTAFQDFRLMSFEEPETRTSKPRIDTGISLLMTCKVFSAEAIEVLYTHNGILLDGTAEVYELFTRSLEARRAKKIKLINVTPLRINDQEDVDDVLKPVDFVGAHCQDLQLVTIPWTNATRCNHARTVIRGIVMPLEAMWAEFESERYPFGLMLWNQHLGNIWREYVTQGPIEADLEAQHEKYIDATADVILNNTTPVDLIPDDEDNFKRAQALMLGVFELMIKLYEQDKSGDGLDSNSHLYARLLEDFQPALDGRTPEVLPFGQTFPYGDREALCWLNRVLTMVDRYVKHEFLCASLHSLL